jgi:hypothetical protein
VGGRKWLLFALERKESLSLSFFHDIQRLLITKTDNTFFEQLNNEIMLHVHLFKKNAPQAVDSLVNRTISELDRIHPRKSLDLNSVCLSAEVPIISGLGACSFLQQIQRYYFTLKHRFSVIGIPEGTDTR